MTLSSGVLSAIVVFGLVGGAWFVVLLLQGFEIGRRLWIAGVHAPAVSFFEFSAYFYARVSKAVSINFGSISQLPYRRRDLIS